VYITVTEFDAWHMVVKWRDKHTVKYVSQESQSSTELCKHILLLIAVPMCKSLCKSGDVLVAASGQEIESVASQGV
jgi:hypothetical protein